MVGRQTFRWAGSSWWRCAFISAHLFSVTRMESKKSPLFRLKIGTSAVSCSAHSGLLHLCSGCSRGSSLGTWKVILETHSIHTDVLNLFITTHTGIKATTRPITCTFLSTYLPCSGRNHGQRGSFIEPRSARSSAGAISCFLSNPHNSSHCAFSPSLGRWGN